MATSEEMSEESYMSLVEMHADIKSMPYDIYFHSYLWPLIEPALKALVRVRPERPRLFLARYFGHLYFHYEREGATADPNDTTSNPTVNSNGTGENITSAGSSNNIRNNNSSTSGH